MEKSDRTVSPLVCYRGYMVFIIVSLSYFSIIG
jgi:hypothetical protein